MSYVRSSANYVWCTKDLLGEGTFGSVFKGVSKHDGELVAVKTFKRRSPCEAHLREFEMLKKVNHENIVKLLAIEEETYHHDKVIIMELCTEGSLRNILEDPENIHGLPEDDFLLVLSHLSAGMKYLRDNNIVHRDLKPGNIMKFIAEDGQVIFKLVDFGAARELQEDQEFFSIHGTPEYCHPDLYERMVLLKDYPTVGIKPFSASVDLWSIGVTLYHVATGCLPFRPYGGRTNKETMYFITTTKESGVIAGWQLTQNGEIEWKRELPATCQISNGLKRLITPLLAGLMEVEESKRWTYDVFFDAVEKIMAKTRVHIFYLNKIQTLRVYMDPDPQRSPASTMPHSSTPFFLRPITPCKIFQAFQKLIQEQTEITPENQIILHKGQNLAQAQFKFMLPVTSEENPVILCDKKNVSAVFEWDMQDLSEFPVFSNHENIDLENDSTLAKLSCGVGYFYKRKIEEICLQVHLITVAVETIVNVTSLDLSSVLMDSYARIKFGVRAVGQISSFMEKEQKNLVAMARMKEERSEDTSMNSASVSASNAQSKSVEDSPNFNALTELEGSLKTRLDSMEKTSNTHASIFRNLQQRMESLEQDLKQFHSGFVQKQSLMPEWRKRALNVSSKIQSKIAHSSQSVSSFPLSIGQGQNASQIQINCATSCISGAGKKALTHVGKLRESWQHLSRDETARYLTCNGEQFHNLEKIKMQAKSKCLSELLNEECQPVIVGLTQVLSDWYKLARAALIQTDIMAKNITRLDTALTVLFPFVNGNLKVFHTGTEFVIQRLKDRATLWPKLEEEILTNASNSHLNPALGRKMQMVGDWVMASVDELQLRGQGQGRKGPWSNRSSHKEKLSMGASVWGLRICLPCRSKCGPCLRRGCQLAQSAARV